MTRKSVQPARVSKPEEKKKVPKVRGRKRAADKAKGKPEEEEEEEEEAKGAADEEEVAAEGEEPEEGQVKLERVVQVRVEDCSVSNTESAVECGDESSVPGVQDDSEATDDIPAEGRPTAEEEPPVEGATRPLVAEEGLPKEAAQRKEEEEGSEEGLTGREDTEEPGSASQEDDDGPLPATSPFR